MSGTCVCCQDGTDTHTTSEPVGEQIMEHINDSNYARIALYLTSCAAYVPEPDDTMVYKVVFDIYKKVDRFSEALRVAIRLNDSTMAQEVLDACEDELHKKQLCFKPCPMARISNTLLAFGNVSPMSPSMWGKRKVLLDTVHVVMGRLSRSESALTTKDLEGAWKAI